MKQRLEDRPVRWQMAVFAAGAVATLCLLTVPRGEGALAQAAGDFSTACQVPQGQSAEGIVRRVERRLQGDWGLAVTTLRRSISRQQRLGQDSSEAEAYLASLECLQAEVGSGRHDAYIASIGGQAPRRAAAPTPSAPAPAGSTASPAAPAQAQAQAAPAQIPAPASPALGAGGASSSPAPLSPTTPPAAGLGASPKQQSTTPVMPGTAESYALFGQGGTSSNAAAGVPLVRPLDGGNPLPQGSAAAPHSPQAAVASSPVAPRARTQPPEPTNAAPQPAVPAPAPPAAQPQGGSPALAALPGGSGAGDPRFVGKSCLYFTRPEFEVVRSRVFTNRYRSGERVCHEGSMYLCDGGLWSGQGACSAFADAAERDSSVLEAAPRR